MSSRPVYVVEFRGTIRISSGVIPAPLVVTKAIMACVESVIPFLGGSVPAEVLALYLLTAISSSVTTPPRVMIGVGTVVSHMEVGHQRCVVSYPSGPESVDVAFELDGPKRFLYYFTASGERTDYSGEGVFSVAIYLEKGRHLIRACWVSPEWVPLTVNWPQYTGTLIKLAAAVFRV